MKPSEKVSLPREKRRILSSVVVRKRKVNERLSPSSKDTIRAELARFRGMFEKGKGIPSEEATEPLRALLTRLQQMLEEERIELAREVHDSLGSSLTGMGMDLANLKKRLVGCVQPSLKDSIVEQIDRMSHDVEDLIGQVRSVATRLRPPVLDELGLAAAMVWLTRDFERRNAIRCEFELDPDLEVENGELATAIFRIYQEILTNIARHSGATAVRARGQIDRKGFRLEVSDNGRGITKGEQNKSLGLLGMRERALIFDGEVEIEGRAGKGTTVRLIIPSGIGSTAFFGRTEEASGERSLKRMAKPTS